MLDCKYITNLSLLNEIPFFVPKLFAVFMYVFVIKYKTLMNINKISRRRNL